jgi:hypothetical protein
MKIAVCVAPPPADCYGHLRRYAAQLTLAAARRGVTVETLHYGAPDFFPRLFANLADEQCIIHFYGYLYDLRLQMSVAGDALVHAFDTSRAAGVATIGDHPFSPFMHRLVRNAHRKTRFIVLDKTFRDEALVLNPALSQASYHYRPITPPVNFDQTRVKPFGARSYDLVVPMHLTDMAGHGIAFIMSHISSDWFKRTVAGMYETALSDTDRNPMHIFVECLCAELGEVSLAQIAENNIDHLNQMLIAIGSVDALVRQERRQRMISNLLRRTGDLRVAVTSKAVPTLKVDDRVRFVGMQNIEGTVALMSDTRAVLNCSPTYPTNVHERISSGMMYGSCIITDTNPYIRNAFAAHEYVAYGPDSVMTIADIYDGGHVAGVAEAGARRVRSDPAYGWDAHIDGLMQAASAQVGMAA